MLLYLSLVRGRDSDRAYPTSSDRGCSSNSSIASDSQSINDNDSIISS